MAKKKFSQWKMPQPWRVMVDLAFSQKIASDLSSLVWDHLRTFTMKNNLATPVYMGSQKELAPEDRNRPQMLEIRLVAKMNRLQSQRRIQALAEIAHAFHQADIPMLSFKGPLLSEELYGSPEIRNSCDLDILVAEERLLESCQLLQKLEYEEVLSVWEKTPKRRAFHQRSKQQMHRIFRKDGVTVELHWRISYRYSISFDTLYQTRRCRSLLGQPVDTLSHSENLCYLIAHGAGHGFRQLRWLIEIYLLLKKEDFALSSLYAQMRERGVGMLLLETLLLLYRLPGFSMPDKLCIQSGEKTILFFQRQGEKTLVFWQSEVTGELHHARKLAAIAISLLRRNDSREGLDGRMYQQCLPILENQPGFFRSLFAPCTSELEWLDLPDFLFFLYYILRPIHFFLGRIQRKSRHRAKSSKNGEKS